MRLAYGSLGPSGCEGTPTGASSTDATTRKVWRRFKFASAIGAPAFTLSAGSFRCTVVIEARSSHAMSLRTFPAPTERRTNSRPPEAPLGRQCASGMQRLRHTRNCRQAPKRPRHSPLPASRDQERIKMAARPRIPKKPVDPKGWRVSCFQGPVPPAHADRPTPSRIKRAYSQIFAVLSEEAPLSAIWKSARLSPSTSPSSRLPSRRNSPAAPLNYALPIQAKAQLPVRSAPPQRRLAAPEEPDDAPRSLALLQADSGEPPDRRIHAHRGDPWTGMAVGLSASCQLLILTKP
jgi:hypothetical protein